MSKFVTAPGKATTVTAPEAAVNAGGAVATVEAAAGAVTADGRKKRGKQANFVGLGIHYESLETAKANPPQLVENFEGDREAAEKTIRILEVHTPDGKTSFVWGNSAVFVLSGIAKQLGYTVEVAERAKMTGSKNRIPSEDKALSILWKSLIKAGKVDKARQIMMRDYPEQQASFNKIVADMAAAA